MERQTKNTALKSDIKVIASDGKSVVGKPPSWILPSIVMNKRHLQRRNHTIWVKSQSIVAREMQLLCIWVSLARMVTEYLNMCATASPVYLDSAGPLSGTTTMSCFGSHRGLARGACYVRNHQDPLIPHTFQVYTCEINAPHAVSCPLRKQAGEQG